MLLKLLSCFTGKILTGNERLQHLSVVLRLRKELQVKILKISSVTALLNVYVFICSFAGRKTPGSARKRAALSTKSMIPTRETSKRALFQSPPQQKPKPTIPVDVARRVDKSKRMLFSPSHDERDMKAVNSFSQPNGKRRRDDDGLLGNQSKLPRMSGFDDIRTSRTMLAKSQTFCVTKTINNETIMNAPSVQRARSDVTLNGSQQLSQSHRRKLLWAVSTSLKKKNINTQHPNFTAFAGVLAKVVKRLFLETRVESASTSDTMIR